MPLVLRPATDARPALTARLAALGRTRRRVAVGAAALTLVGVGVGLAGLAGGLDAWLHLPPLARAAALVGTLAAVGLALGAVLSAARLRTDPLSVALELEDRYPSLNDALASAVSFLSDADRAEDRGVSRRLRHTTARRAERKADRHDFDVLVPTARLWRAGWLALLAVAVVGPLAAWDTARAGTALVRLADPFGGHPWPAKTRIDLFAPATFPARLPRGEAFELQFAVVGVVPDRATVEVRAAGDEWEEAYPLDPKSAAVTARFDAARLASDFAVRVRANDADTGWLAVAVVPPPRLVPLDGRPSPQVRAVPPAYTGLPAIELPDGVAVAEVPVGTVLTFRAAADVRLASAALVYQGDRAGVDTAAPLAPVGHLNPLAAVGAQLLADAVPADIPLVVSGDGKTLHGTFRPVMSGMYALRLTDETGLTGTRLFELRLTADPAPVVLLVRPAVGRDPALVVPSAVVPIHVMVDDRVYGPRRTVLEYRVGQEGQTREVLLTEAGRGVGPLTAVTGGAVGAVVGGSTRAEVRTVFPVVGFLRDDGTPVRDGDLVILRAAADDWDDVSVLKAPGRSSEVELRVSSPEAVDAVLQKELAGLRPDLARLLDQQREATRKTEAVKPRPDGTLTPADAEALGAAEQAQRQVRGRVTDARDGLRAKAELLRETARANNLKKSDATDLAGMVADRLGRLADRDLAAIDPKLGDARQAGTQPPKPGQPPAAPGLLAQAGRHQKEVEDDLSLLLDLLSRWGDAAEIRGEARVLRDEAMREAGAADQLPEKVPPGKAADRLTPEQRAELDRAAGRAERLADQTNALRDKAAKLAADKEGQAAAKGAAAADAEKEAAGLTAKAAGKAPGTPEAKELNRQAAAKAAEAADARAAAERAAAEAAALRKGLEAAGGQALPDDLRKAADAARANRQGEAAERERSAADRLDKLAESLAEQKDPSVPELEKKRKQAADSLDALGNAQEDLRQRTAEAGKEPDAGKRADQLKQLAAEQQKLADRTREAVQRLTRDRETDAARDARAALDKMEAAKDDLARGENPQNDQADAVDKLDQARDQLDQSGERSQRELTDEKRRKLADAVKALLDQQTAAVAEADRVQAKVLADKEWDRALLTSYSDLEDRERGLAVEVRALADRDLADLPVFARLLKDASASMDRAADKVKERGADAVEAQGAFDAELEATNHAKVRRPMDAAVRRLTQVHEALKAEQKGGKPPAKKGGGGSGGGPMGGEKKDGGGGGGDGDVVPPLAQLKALRALQAEVEERTAAFNKAHPDRDRLSDDDRADLKEIEDAQRDIPALFKELTRLFEQRAPTPENKP